MAVIITPGQLARRGEFYHQLASLLTAGMTLVQSLEQIHRAPPSVFLRRPLQALIDGLGQGLTFGEALRTVPGWLPIFDVALLTAGEQSGRLDSSFQILGEYYDDRARLARQVISGLTYPLFILHFAILVIPFPQLFLTGNWGPYLSQTLGPLIPAWGIVLLFLYAGQARRGIRWRGVVEGVLRQIPVLGKARHHLALSRLSLALEALLSAGVPVISAWPMAAAASSSPALERAVAGWKQALLTGESPADLLRSTRAFPEMFSNLYSTGEISGKIDDTLKRLRRYYQDDSARKMQALAQWVPRFLYLIIVVLLGMQIIGFWTNYYGGMTGRVDTFMEQ